MTDPLREAAESWADDFDDGWGDQFASGEFSNGGFTLLDHGSDHTAKDFRLLAAIRANLAPSPTDDAPPPCVICGRPLGAENADHEPCRVAEDRMEVLRLDRLTGQLLHRAWMKSGRRDPLLDADAWDGFALTVRAVAQVERITSEGPIRGHETDNSMGFDEPD